MKTDGERSNAVCVKKIREEVMLKSGRGRRRALSLSLNACQGLSVKPSALSVNQNLYQIVLLDRKCYWLNHRGYLY